MLVLAYSCQNATLLESHIAAHLVYLVCLSISYKLACAYSKTAVTLKKTLLLNAGQKYCRML